MISAYDNMFEWLKSKSGKVIRYNIYRRMFTPYEIEQKYSDESFYEDGIYYNYGIIEEIISLGNDYLIGFRICDIDDDEGVTRYDNVEYVRLSEIRMTIHDVDNGGDKQ